MKEREKEEERSRVILVKALHVWKCHNEPHFWDNSYVIS